MSCSGAFGVSLFWKIWTMSEYYVSFYTANSVYKYWIIFLELKTDRSDFSTTYLATYPLIPPEAI